jgi:hypothetical protein
MIEGIVLGMTGSGKTAPLKNIITQTRLMLSSR